MTRRASGDSGQDLVEYAIVFTLLFLLILGIIEFAIVVFTQNSVANVAREGARWAVVRRTTPNPSSYLPATGTAIGPSSCAAATNRIMQEACDHAVALDDTRAQVTVSRPSTDEIRVQVTYSYDPFFGLIGQFLPSSLQLGSQATMRLE